MKTEISLDKIEAFLTAAAISSNRGDLSAKIWNDKESGEVFCWCQVCGQIRQAEGKLDATGIQSVCRVCRTELTEE